MRTRDHEELAPLVNLADITAIELVVLKRMRELTLGDHRSRAQERCCKTILVSA